MPTIVWNAMRTTLTGGRCAAGTVSSPVIVAFGSWSASSESMRGHLDAVAHLAVACTSRSRCTGAPVVVLPQPLEGRELDGLVARDVARRPVADHDLHGRGQRGDGQRDRQRDALVVVAPPAQPAPRVDGGDDEADDDVARQVHVDELVPEVRLSNSAVHGCTSTT